MEEVLSKPDDSKKPHHEQVFFALRMVESSDIWRPGHLVEQTRIEWSQLDLNFMCEETETERCKTLAEARKRYEARRAVLLAQGFTRSDMDL